MSARPTPTWSFAPWAGAAASRSQAAARVIAIRPVRCATPGTVVAIEWASAGWAPLGREGVADAGQLQAQVPEPLACLGVVGVGLGGGLVEAVEESAADPLQLPRSDHAVGGPDPQPARREAMPGRLE